MILIIKLIRLIVADDLACDIKSGEIPATNATEPVKDSRCRFQICERDDFGKQIAGQEETEALRSGQPPNMLADVLQPPRQIADPRGSDLRTSRWDGDSSQSNGFFHLADGPLHTDQDGPGNNAVADIQLFQPGKASDSLHIRVSQSMPHVQV